MDDDIPHVAQTLNRLSRKFKNRRKQHDRKYMRRKDVERNHYDGLVVVDDDVTTLSAVENRSEFFLSGVSLNDHYISKILDERTRLNKSTLTYKETFISDHRSWTNFSRETYKDFQIIEFSREAGMIIDTFSKSFLDYSVNSNSVEIKLCGEKDFVDYHTLNKATGYSLSI